MARVDQPLTDAEYARIALILERSRSKGAMNLEMLDGFFAALICSPDVIPPTEYLREIWGGKHIGDFKDEAEMQEFFDLVMRHWNSLAKTFNSREPFMPFLLEDDARRCACERLGAGICVGHEIAQRGLGRAVR